MGAHLADGAGEKELVTVNVGAVGMRQLRSPPAHLARRGCRQLPRSRPLLPCRANKHTLRHDRKRLFRTGVREGDTVSKGRARDQNAILHAVPNHSPRSIEH